MSKELEAAADELGFIDYDDGVTCAYQEKSAFKAGSQWAIRNAPEVQKLVEALEAINDYMVNEQNDRKSSYRTGFHNVMRLEAVQTKANEALAAYRKSCEEV